MLAQKRGLRRRDVLGWTREHAVSRRFSRHRVVFRWGDEEQAARERERMLWGWRQRAGPSAPAAYGSPDGTFSPSPNSLFFFYLFPCSWRFHNLLFLGSANADTRDFWKKMRLERWDCFFFRGISFHVTAFEVKKSESEQKRHVLDRYTDAEKGFRNVCYKRSILRDDFFHLWKQRNTLLFIKQRNKWSPVISFSFSQHKSSIMTLFFSCYFCKQ